ncbi:MAG: methyltransferase domain-containing protein [Candidatus Staskawiczbacteria bacterium]|nr:methyltransferase domain-containing protein [Candidatus Staskawiczbacteria bacterium]
MRNENNMENVWDKIYKNYEGPDAINKYIYSKLIKVLEKYISPKDSILEAGCGSGYVVSYFQNKGHYSVGLDCNSQPLKIAKEVFGAKNLKKGDLFDLPFENSSFNIVWNEGVLEHFKMSKSIEAVREMARVSKKYVIIDVPNRYSLFVISKILAKIAGKWQYGYEESYSAKRLKCLMERAGLEVVGIHGVYLAPQMRVWKNWKSMKALFFLTIPLPETAIIKILNAIGKIEDNHPVFSRFFSFHLIMVGQVNKK